MSFELAYSNFEKTINDYLKNIYKNIFAGNNVCIWGTGPLGRLRLRLFQNFGMGKQVVAFVNTFHRFDLPSKTLIDGIEELSPKEAIIRFPNAKYLISSDFYKEIIQYIDEDIPHAIDWTM